MFLQKKTYTGKEITLSSGEYTLTKIGKTYVEGQDFELSYEDNTNAGTATVYANGIGNYTGSVKATFTIQKLSLTDSHVVVEPEKIAIRFIPEIDQTGYYLILSG